MTSLDTATDSLLAQRSADGDTRAFAVLVRRHGPFLRAFATRLTGSASDADDAVQEALIAAWGQLDTLRDTTKVRSWLVSIVSRKATDRIRARRTSDELDDDLPAMGATPEQAAVASSRLEALSAVLASLPDGQRQCWVLKELGGYSYEQTGDELGMSPTTVRGKLARARAAMVTGMEARR